MVAMPKELRGSLGEAPRGMGYPKSVRLAGRAAIDAVFKDGRYHRLGILHAKALRSPRDVPRFLISVKKSIGNAPERNRIKRVVREAIRRQRHRLRRPHDICLFLTARPRRAVTLDGMDAEILKLFELLDWVSDEP